MWYYKSKMTVISGNNGLITRCMSSVIGGKTCMVSAAAAIRCPFVLEVIREVRARGSIADVCCMSLVIGGELNENKQQQCPVSRVIGGKMADSRRTNFGDFLL